MSPALLLLVLLDARAVPPTAARITTEHLPFHVGYPLARTLTVECEDPDQVPPLAATCLVADVTDGDLGSGSEIVLEDVDCGEQTVLAPHPIRGDDALWLDVTYDFDVVSPVAGHRYAYAVACTDGDDEVGTFFQQGVYDDSAPVTELLTGPNRVTFETTAEFDAICTDDAFDDDWSFTDGDDTDVAPDLLPTCTMTCAVYEGADTVPFIGPIACGTETVFGVGEAGHWVVRNLPPGRYRLELYAQDDVELEAEPVTWSWRVLRPPPDTGWDALYDDTAWATDSDTGWPWEPDAVDTDPPPVVDTDLPLVDTDDEDPLPIETDVVAPTDDTTPPTSGCDCDTSGRPLGTSGAAGLAVGLLALAVRRRR